MFSVIYTDDESMLLEVGKKFLELSGRLKVETALSAKEAVEIMKEKEIDCIVSDYMMPETDGIEFLRQLREEENNVPFILFTGRGREEIAIEALNAGADFYLQKGGDPVSQFKELEHKIIQAAERRKALNELRKSEEKYRILTEMTEDILYSLDTKGVITHVGPQVKRYGFEPGDFISKRIEDLIFEDDIWFVFNNRRVFRGDPADVRIMNHHQLTVTAKAAIQFKIISAKFDRFFESGTRVFWRDGAGPTMGNHKRLLRILHQPTLPCKQHQATISRHHPRYNNTLFPTDAFYFVSSAPFSTATTRNPTSYTGCQE